MDLYCRLRVEGRAERDVALDVGAASTVAEVVAALAAPLGVDPARAELVVGDTVADPDQLVAASEIVHGATLLLRPASGAMALGSGRKESWSVRVTHPEHPTRIVGLTPGRHIIGADPSALVPIAGPGVTLGHLILDLARDGAVRVSAGAGNVVVAGSPLAPGQALQLSGPTTIELGTGHVVHVDQLQAARGGGVDRLGQLLVNRPPHPTIAKPDADLGSLGSPPSEGTPAQFGWLTALLPAAVGVLAAVLLSAPMFLVFALMGPAMATGSFLEQRRRTRRRDAEAASVWEERLADKERAVAAVVAGTRTARLARNPSATELRGAVALRSPQVWSQRPAGDGFASVRVGAGDVTSGIELNLPDRWTVDDEAARDRIAALGAAAAVVAGSPLVIDLCGTSTVALWGTDSYEVANSALVSLAASVSPADLVMCAAVGPELAWMKWLPHLRSADSPIDGAHLSADAEAPALRSVLSLEPDRPGPRVVVVLDGALGIDASTAATLVEVASDPARRVSILWVGGSHLDAPAGTALTVRCEDGHVELVDVADGTRISGESDRTPFGDAEDTARLLAPLADATASDRSASIPAVVELADLVGPASPASIAARWAAHTPGTLCAPVGVGADGPVEIDLVTDGPHALVAGTSGSGKSELLQTWVASLAAQYPPSEATFLFVDYKGGSATEVFVDLPHTVGFVTDLDEAGAHRALVSLRAEVRRREHLQAGKAPDRDTWARNGEGAPPSLIIVVDEFATLVREIPEFVDGILDVAQRGRSLGLHLVLATQRPAGVVSESILANIGIRLCLRTMDASDSATIVGVTDAATIPQPLRGRAILRRGSDTHAVQTGWATAPTRVEDRHRVTVGEFGAPRAAAGAARRASGVAGTHQVDLLTQRCVDAAGDTPRPRRPWMEELPAVITVAEAMAAGGEDRAAVLATPGRYALVGVLDDPTEQSQTTAAVDLETEGGLLCIGSGGSGKTTLLRTAATAAAAASPDACQFVIADFSSQGLGPLRRLPHTIGWAAGGDQESVTRVLSKLAAEITRRRRVLAEHDASTWSELPEPGPRIWLLVDDLGAFRSEFDNVDYGRWVEELRRVAVDGRQVGVHLLATADRRAVVPAGVASAVSARIVLRCADPDEYTVMGIPRAAQRSELAPGRGWLNSQTVQVAALSPDASGPAAAAAIAGLAQRSGPRRTEMWEPLPEHLALRELQAARATTGLAQPVGVAVADLTGATVAVDLAEHLTVVGPPRSGRTTALVTLAAAAAATGRPMFARTGELTSRLAAAGIDHRGFEGVDELVMLLAEPHTATPVVFLDECDGLVEDFSAAPLEGIAQSGTATLCVALDAATAARAWSGWVTAVRRSRQLWWLVPEAALSLGVPADIRTGVALVPGRGVLSTREGVTLCQAATL